MIDKNLEAQLVNEFGTETAEEIITLIILGNSVDAAIQEVIG